MLFTVEIIEKDFYETSTVICKLQVKVAASV